MILKNDTHNPRPKKVKKWGRRKTWYLDQWSESLNTKSIETELNRDTGNQMIFPFFPLFLCLINLFFFMHLTTT